jgi:zinc transport system permease protein
MFEVFTLPFFQRAFLAGVLVGFLSSYYGVFVVQRRMGFLGSGLAHAAFGGVAMGLFFNQEPLLFAIPFTILVAIAITYVKEKTNLAEDTTIGIFFSVSMALGIIFIALKKNYSSDAFNYLFGSILAVNQNDIYITLALVFLTALLSPLWRRWAYSSFDRELAFTDKINVVLDDYLLNTLVAITIVVSIKVVGIVLIAAFLVIPSASARLLAKTFSKMTVLSVLLGVTSAIGGLLISYFLDVPSGATIILLQALVFFLFMFISR